MLGQGQHEYTSKPWKGSGPGLGLVVLALYAIFAVFKVPDFLRVSNLNVILYSCAVVLPTTLGMQALLILGQFDLSVGAAAGLVGMVIGLSMAWSHNISVALAAGIVTIVAIGLVNGILVGRLRINPLIATLGTMGVMRSAALVSSDSRVVTGFPEFGFVSTDHVGPISALVLVSVAILAGLESLFRYSAPFRRFYAVGDNPVAADHSGVEVHRVLASGFVLAAFGAGATGFIQAVRQGSVSPQGFPNLALESIAACMIGGGSLTGGKGTMTGAAIGAVVVAATQNLVTLLNVKPEWKDLAVGVLLLFSVGLRVLPFEPRKWRGITGILQMIVGRE